MQPERLSKIAVFIDGAHLYTASRALAIDIDYRNLLEYFRKMGHLVRPYYYTLLVESDDYSPLKPLTDWLSYNGYTVITKPGRDITDGDGRRRVKGSIDHEMLTDMFQVAPALDHIYLIVGNGDFRRPVEAIQAMGVRVSVMSLLKGTPPLVNDDLRRQADEFIDLADASKEFVRPTRPARVPITATPTPAEPFGGGVDATIAAPRRRAAASV